mmetsp:Transcript_31736/g.53538  ORF Transcript_31736/g.53538 Transcript_31736/m.53538 type:complete len:258 (-) Transcript_31736:62-835(-)
MERGEMGRALLKIAFFILLSSGVSYRLPNYTRQLITMKIARPSTEVGNLFSSKFNILLGSSSATRKQILLGRGFNFRVVTADIDEKAIGDRTKDPAELVTLLAKEKAKAIRSKLSNIMPSDLLITGDQVVVFEGEILEKPTDLMEARSFISRYINKSCTTIGSIVLSKLHCNKQVDGVDTATIHFGDIPDDVINAIIAEGDCVHCAGGLMVEHPLLQPYIVKLEGTQESLMGLSPDLLERLLNEVLVMNGVAKRYKR